jgi:hypothetical protein
MPDAYSRTDLSKGLFGSQDRQLFAVVKALGPNPLNFFVTVQPGADRYGYSSVTGHLQI